MADMTDEQLYALCQAIDTLALTVATAILTASPLEHVGDPSDTPNPAKIALRIFRDSEKAVKDGDL